MLNHYIVKWVAKAVKFILMTIMFIVVVILLLYGIISLSGCRTVQKNLQVEKKNIDSTVIIKHDTATQQTIANWTDLLTADSVGITIEFKDSSKPTQHRSSSFIDELMQLANSGQVKNISISAKKLKDSSTNKTVETKTQINNDTTIRIIDKTKIKDSTKSTKSNSNLLAWGGGLILLLSVFFAVWKFGTKKVDTVTNTVDAVDNLINKK